MIGRLLINGQDVGEVSSLDVADLSHDRQPAHFSDGVTTYSMEVEIVDDTLFERFSMIIDYPMLARRLIYRNRKGRSAAHRLIKMGCDRHVVLSFRGKCQRWPQIGANR